MKADDIEWGRFHEVRRRLDRRGLFLNPYLRTLFGESRSSGVERP